MRKRLLSGFLAFLLMVQTLTQQVYAAEIIPKITQENQSEMPSPEVESEEEVDENTPLQEEGSAEAPEEEATPEITVVPEEEATPEATIVPEEEATPEETPMPEVEFIPEAIETPGVLFFLYVFLLLTKLLFCPYILRFFEFF